MRLPPWISLLCAAVVILWGLYRIRLGLRTKEEEARAREKKGLFAMPRRTHLLIGLVYVILGGGLVAITYGWNPLDTGGGDAQPAPGAAPDVVEIETKSP